MPDLELTRTPGDRRLYALEGVGTLRLQGFASRTATVEAGGTSWRIARRGFWQRRIEVTDSTGTPMGEFEPRSLRRGGILRWAGRELALRPASSWRERYALVDGTREVAVLDGKGWGRRPVKITVDDSDAVEPGLLLFTAFSSAGSPRMLGAPPERPRQQPRPGADEPRPTAPIADAQVGRASQAPDVPAGSIWGARAGFSGENPLDSGCF